MTGSLQIKNNKYFIVLNAKKDGKRKQKWIATGLEAKGNKRKATALLSEALKKYEDDDLFGTEDMLFSDYMLEWLEIVKNKVRPNTFVSYEMVVKNHIVPYFKEKQISVKDLRYMHLQKYYQEKLKALSANTIHKHHANIHTALRYAVNPLGLIRSNPSDNIQLPQKAKFVFVGKFYNAEQLNQLFDVVRGTVMESPVLLSGNYGFRRSEVLGLKWESIDFKENVIYVAHTAILVGNETVYVDNTKTSSSLRALPLTDDMKKYLKALKLKQKKDKLFYGDSYDDNDYVCKWEDGSPIKPNYISQTFKHIIEQNNLPPLRFHDLRHSSASMLLNLGFSLKEIQEWLGHKDLSATNMYAHLQYESKVSMANKLQEKLKLVR